jgi:hypothetical protein
MYKTILGAGAVLASALAFNVAATTPASATIVNICVRYPWLHFCKTPGGNPPESSGVGKIVVGCIMGSAAGLIYASIVKGGGLKFYTQKEWEDLKVKVPHPLTTEEAMMIAGTCGLAAFLIRPATTAPAVVKAKG